MSERSYQLSRRLRWPLGLLLVLGMPALWFGSSEARVAAYEVIYPYLGQETQAELRSILRYKEGRPDAEWRARFAARHGPGTWEELWTAVERYGPYEVQGLEAEVAEALSQDDPYLAELALTVASCGRLRDARILARSEAWLGHEKAWIFAAEYRALQGRGAELVPRLRAYLKTCSAKSGSLRTHGYPHLAIGVLHAIGAEARPALPEIHLWLGGHRPVAARVDAACASLGDEVALARLRARFEDPELPGSLRRQIALHLAGLGQRDEAICAELEGALRKSDEVPTWQCLEALAELGPAARRSLPAIRRFLKHKEPAIRETARRAIAAIEGGS